MTAPQPDATPSRFEPPASDAAAPFWEATREERLVLQWCRSCEAVVHFPREACPRCLGEELEYRPSEGRGVVYAVSVMPKPANPLMAGRAPYAVALVDLPEGARLMTNVVLCDPSTVAVGDPVVVAWEPLTDGRNLPLFMPDADA